MSAASSPVPVDVFVERRDDGPAGALTDPIGSARAYPCLQLHGARWQASFLACENNRVLCHFQAPDAESVRLALRTAAVEYDALWAGAVEADTGTAGVDLVVERRFPESPSHADWRGIRTATTRLLLQCGVETVRVLRSRCRRRMVFLCRTASAASAHQARAWLTPAVFDIWACRSLTGASRAVACDAAARTA